MAIRADEVDLARDKDLVERYQAGDPTAFDDLYQRYFRRLRQFCLRRVGDPHEAEELAQEAFTRALRALPAFAGERRFYPWMTVIAQRLCVDHHRRLWRITPEPDVDPGLVTDDDYSALYAESDLTYLGAALERLAPRHREILHLREQEGLSYQQIADRLDVPVTTVEALLHRARKALRREFTAVGGGRLAGVPLLGWIVRHLDGVRGRFVARVGERVQELGGLGNLAAPMTAGAMTLALAVAPAFGGSQGSTVVTEGGAIDGTATAHTTAPPTPPGAPVSVGSNDGDAGRDGGAGSTGPASGGGGASAAPPSPTAPGPIYRPATVGPAKIKWRTADPEADDQPRVIRVGPVTIGADPTVVGAAARDTVQDPAGTIGAQLGGNR